MPLIRQGLEALGQHRPGGDLHRQLAPVGAAQGAAHADEVTGIHQGGDLGKGAGGGRPIPRPTLRRGPVQGGLLQVQLDRAGLIGEGEEGQLAHHPPRHHPAGDGHLQVPLFPVGQVGMVLLQGRGAMAGVKTQGIGPLAQLRQGAGFLKAGLAQLRQGSRALRWVPSCRNAGGPGSPGDPLVSIAQGR